MRKIRYEEINTDEYYVVLPNYSDDPIGIVYKDIFRSSKPWRIKPRFITLYRDNNIGSRGYEDFAIAGRSLADIWEYTMFLTEDESTDEYGMGDLFKNIDP
jgi:hypothetical protein